MNGLAAARASLYRVTALLDGVTTEALAHWINAGSLAGRLTRTFANFEIVASR